MPLTGVSIAQNHKGMSSQIVPNDTAWRARGKLRPHILPSKGEVTPIFSGVGTAISHEPDEPESVPVVPVVPAPELESAPWATSVIFWIGYKKKIWSKCNLMREIITLKIT